MPEARIKPGPQAQQARVLSITQLPLRQNSRKDGKKEEEDLFKKAILTYIKMVKWSARVDVKTRIKYNNLRQK